MLTKELLINRTSKGRIRPGFVDVGRADLVGLAEELVEIADGGLGMPRGVIEEALAVNARGHKRPKLAKGLVKFSFNVAHKTCFPVDNDTVNLAFSCSVLF